MDEDQTTPTDEDRQPTADARFVAGATSGPSIRELEDSSLLGGLFGSKSVHSILEGLREEWRLRGLEHDLQAKRDDEAWAAYGDELREERKGLESELDAVDRERRQAEDQLDEVLQQDRTLSGLKSRLSLRLRARRTSYPLRLLDRLQERLITTERRQLEVARERHLLAQETRKLNQDEYERRIVRLTGQRDEADGQLSRLRDKLESLRHIGIHRTSAGFLSWAGYLAFPAVGWFIGERLRRLDEGDGGFQALVRLLADVLVTLNSAFGFWATLAGSIVIPLLLLALFYGLLLFNDSLVRRFNTRWGKDRPEETRNRWLPRPHEDVTRGDYGRMIARLPLLVASLLLPIGLAIAIAIGGASDDQVAGLAGEPWSTVLYTFLGIVTVVATTGVTLLYTSHVTGRRIEDAGAREQPLSTIRLHIELVALVVTTLLLTAISSLDRMPWGELPPSLDSPLPLLLGMLGVGLVTSYGLVYKGFFRDERSLLRQRDAIDQVIESYSAFPLVPQQEREINEYLRMLSRLRRYVELQWKMAEGSEPRLWQRRIRRWMRGPAAGHFPYNSLDLMFEPEVVGEIDDLESAASVLSPQAERARERLQRLIERHRQATERLKAVRMELRELAAQSDQRRSNALQRKFSMSRFYSNALTRCEAAHAAGEALRSPSGPPTPPPTTPAMTSEEGGYVA